MKLSLPFYNRENYIKLSAYTYSRRILKHSPVGLTNDVVKAVTAKPDKDKLEHHNFSTCFGATMARKKSVTLQSWSELYVSTFGSDNFYTAPVATNTLHYTQSYDESYALRDGLVLTKLYTPWRFLCNKKELLWVYGKSIMNMTPMIIPTGILNYEITHVAHIFNSIPVNTKYKIPYAHPLMTLYPMSDLPIHVEAIHDEEKFYSLDAEDQTRPFFSAVGVKQYKMLENKC